MNPGIRQFPARSTILVSGLFSAWREVRLPVATILPPLTARAECVNKNETENKKELVWNRLAARSRHRWIDPNGGGYHGWGGQMVDKALRMGETSRG